MCNNLISLNDEKHVLTTFIFVICHPFNVVARHCGETNHRMNEDELLSLLDEGIGKMSWQTIRPTGSILTFTV